MSEQTTLEQNISSAREAQTMLFEHIETLQLKILEILNRLTKIEQVIGCE